MHDETIWKQTNQVESCPSLHHHSSIYLPCHRQSPLAAHASLFWLTTSTTPPVVEKITVTMVMSHVTQNITFDYMVWFIKTNLPNKPYQYFSRILCYGMPWILIIQSRGGNLKETYNSHRYLFQKFPFAYGTIWYEYIIQSSQQTKYYLVHKS